MRLKHPLDPIYNNNSKILILGTFPSIISRNDNFYYANKNNRFWKILENIFNIRLENYEDKKQFLLNNNIALWDVIKSCEIKNSDDSSIKNVIPNDIDKIIKNSSIKYIFVTGKIALKYYNKYISDKTNIKAIYLPSPSSANATYSLDKLIKEYRIILNYLK